LLKLRSLAASSRLMYPSFESAVTPNASALTREIERLLAEQATAK
jgi:hypothetical protein